MIASIGVSRPAHAQELVIRPAEGLGSLARSVARTYSRRTGREVAIGEPPPSIPEAVPAGHLALVQTEGTIWLGLGAEGGHTVTTEIPVEGRASARARTVALALEELEDDARALPAPAPEPERNYRVYLEYNEVPPPSREYAAPMVYLRVLAGYSPVRQSFLVGPGAGFGLCVDVHCVAIEADLPLLAEEVQTHAGLVRYRAVNASVRVQLRPVVVGRHSVGVTLGFLTRIGNATVVDTDFTQSVNNLGIRSTLEYAYRISGPFEFVAEAGVDYAIATSRLRVFYAGQSHYLEDTWTPWLVTSFRVRPDLRRESDR